MRKSSFSSVSMLRNASHHKLLCGLNEDIQLLVGILELKEFVVLVDRAQKVEDLSKSKKKVDLEVQNSSKRQLGKLFSSPS
ncbi:zf-CCHC domain-containing protein/RVP_2 domain-containing protein [Gossypium australe]|uniref:Zf-CCHC domain-containing protein/RVP_2 domain-containing protein n=1 Tax=Gossypium australe TaxID=47621 RepID=A0A5B6VMT4_9ROSI|nr:zf-CCHC domain-containing protein/RVP_2 domain-containing protein [Gossypium australe]